MFVRQNLLCRASLSILLLLLPHVAVAASFAPPVVYQAGSGPNSVTVGDFNADGKEDLAVSNLLSNNVSVLLGNGDGTFQPPINYPVGAAPVSIVATCEHLGSNPATVLAVANSGDNTISVLVSNADGTFQPAVNYSTGTGTDPRSVISFPTIVGSQNCDLVVANRSGGPANTGNIAVLLGNGDGTFQPASNYDVLGTQPVSLAEGTFSQNPYGDLAVADFGSNDITILQNDGEGRYTATTTYSVGTAPSYIMSLYPGSSLLVTNSVSNDITLLYNIPGGGLGYPRTFPVGPMPSSVAVGTFNSSQYLLDVVVTDQADSTLSTFLGKRDKPFLRKPSTIATCSSPNYSLAANIRKIKRDDLLVTCSDGVGVMLSTGP